MLIGHSGPVSRSNTKMGQPLGGSPLALLLACDGHWGQYRLPSHFGRQTQGRGPFALSIFGGGPLAANGTPIGPQTPTPP